MKDVKARRIAARQAALIQSSKPAHIQQLIRSRAHLMNNVGGGINNIGDSISHGAHCGNAFTNHWTMLMARAVNAAFNGRGIGFIPMEHVYNHPGDPNGTKQIHDVSFSGTDWGARSANPAPFDYPLGNVGPTVGGIALGSENIVNGKSYSSSVNGATITISTFPLTEKIVFMATQQPGGGVFNVSVNGAAVGTINTNGALTYNKEYTFSIGCNGKGACTVVLTKADASPTEINAVIGYREASVAINDLSTRMTFNNFSQSGRTLSDMNESCIIRACNAVGLIVSLGVNDWYGYHTDTDDVAFAKLQQKVNWVIHYVNVYRCAAVVQDFIWYATLEGSRTRRELKRIADETNGVYIPYPDWFFNDGVPPTSSPLVLNNPMYLWADTLHPNALGNELIFATLSTAMGFAVRSKRMALEYHDWAWPVQITHPDWVNETPTFIRSISTIQQQGSGYRIKLNLDYTAAATAPAGLYQISTGVSSRYRGGVSPGLMFETQQVGTVANDVLWTQNNFEVGLTAGTAFVAGIKKTRVVEGTV